MVNGKKLVNIIFILVGIFFYNCLSIAMEKPYHHLPDGTFRNPEGSPKRDPNVKEEVIFKDKIGRIRDIQVHPNNGKIYFLAGDSLWLMEKN